VLNIYRSEASASLRRVPIWLVLSNGTAPATAEAGGQPQINWIPRGAATVNTAATLSLVSANAGEYYVELTASEVSALGMAAIHYRSATAIPNSTYFGITNIDSGNSRDMGITAFSEVTLHAGTHSGATIQGIANYANISNVTLSAGVHSGATVQGVQRVDSTVTAVTISAVTLAGGTYSNVTIGGVNRVMSAVTLAAGTFSDVTVRVENVTTVDTAAIADRLLGRAIQGGADGGRTVTQALRTLRNRVLLDGSTMTIFAEDDATSSWTASVTTTADTSHLNEINPVT
jgi:hypothetical protein